MSINDTPQGGILTIDEAEKLLLGRQEDLEQQSKTVRPWTQRTVESLLDTLQFQKEHIKDLEARLERAEKAIERIIFG